MLRLSSLKAWHVYALLLYLALFSSGDLERLTKEISTMLSFEHPNVMSLVGVCLDGEMPLLIMPFMANGSVLAYVRHHKQELLLTSEATEEEVWLTFIGLVTLPSLTLLHISLTLLHFQLFSCRYSQ